MIPHSAQALWAAYSASIGIDRSPDFYKAFHLHDNAQAAQELAAPALQAWHRVRAPGWALAQPAHLMPALRAMAFSHMTVM